LFSTGGAEVIKFTSREISNEEIWGEAEENDVERLKVRGDFYDIF
jgi:hypothetical protein